MERFCKNTERSKAANRFLQKSSIMDVQLGPKYAPENDAT